MMNNCTVESGFMH